MSVYRLDFESWNAFLSSLPSASASSSSVFTCSCICMIGPSIAGNFVRILTPFILLSPWHLHLTQTNLLGFSTPSVINPTTVLSSNRPDRESARSCWLLWSRWLLWSTIWILWVEDARSERYHLRSAGEIFSALPLICMSTPGESSLCSKAALSPMALW